MTNFSGCVQTDRSPFYTEERCYISEWLNDPLVTDVSLAQCRVEPGVTTQLHSLGVTERYVIDQGEGFMELDGNTPFKVAVGDSIIIQPDQSQRIRNTGREDLIFLCICTPRFQPDHYRNLENQDTRPLEPDS
ncbi:MAG: cupin domain-containing protein [Pseudomonadota bacterium]